jgi:outer membrane lipoprotein-sorting protein
MIKKTKRLSVPSPATTSHEIGLLFKSTAATPRSRENAAVKISVFLAALALLCAVFGPRLPQSGLVALGYSPETPNLPITFEEVKAAYDQVQDYKCVFSKTELLEKKMLKETMELFFSKPFNVKMVWLQPKKGQKAAYREGKNNNKVRARKGGILGMVAVNLDPTGERAMEDNRHPITQAGIGYLIQKTLEDIAKGQNELKYLGDEPVAGRDCYHLEFMSKGPRNYHYGLRTEFWIDKELRLPIQSKHFDYDNQWIETYTYAQLKLNMGLKDSDFEI